MTRDTQAPASWWGSWVAAAGGWGGGGGGSQHLYRDEAASRVASLGTTS